MAAEFYRRREARPPGRRRIFGAHAAHLRVQLLRCSLTQFSNALAPLLGASPASEPPGSPNLSPSALRRASVRGGCGGLLRQRVGGSDAPVEHAARLDRPLER